MHKMLGIGLLATTVTLNAGDLPLVWKNGNPPELAAENPYLPAMNAHVSRALHLLKQGKGEHPFYLVWGATAAGSKHRDNAELRDLAFKAYDDVTRQRVEKPVAFWDIIGDLEALLLWQYEGKVSREQIATWQQRLRPSVEANIKSITDKTSWVEWAANTLLQSSAILQLAVTSYRRENPKDPDLGRWARVARSNLRKALKIQLPGGAFSYIRHSGPDPVYFAFDTAHLGRYYQLTDDRQARAALIRMAEWGDAATVCGWITPFSSPWWKHVVGSGGPYTGPETLTALADSPTMRGVMAKRRPNVQPYVWSYGNMYGWLPPAGPVTPIGDRCRFDRNANGPALRVGGFDVEMPARPWSDSLFGASFSSDSAIRSCVSAVYLAANQKNPDDKARHGQNAYIMLGEADVDTHSGIVGDGWIAGAGTFAAHLGVCGDLTPASSPWRRTDVWYADADGAAGVLNLACTAPDKVLGIELMVSTPSGDVTLAPEKLGFKDFDLVVSGNNFAAPKVAKGHTFFAWFPLVEAGAREYQSGETFAAQVSLRRPDRPVLAVESIREENGVNAFTVTRDGRRQAEIVYNATAKAVRQRVSAPAFAYLAEGREQAKPRAVKAGTDLKIPAWGILVLR